MFYVKNVLLQVGRLIGVLMPTKKIVTASCTVGVIKERSKNISRGFL